jgi:hypothetical protein
MRVFRMVVRFVRFINRNPLIMREIEHCNENMKYNERFARRDRRASSR